MRILPLSSMVTMLCLRKLASSRLGKSSRVCAPRDSLRSEAARQAAWASCSMSFLKFAILATLGECIALRITTGVYNRPGFGVLPKAIIWGLLGIGIKIAFTVYGAGTFKLLNEMGLLSGAPTTFGAKLLMSFSISVLINTLFAPVLMITHKLTDLHIAATGGTLNSLCTKPDVAALFRTIDWNSMWSFVLKKTIPFFWIPAHTITFMLPAHFQVVFAAALGIALGVILAFAGLRAKKA